MTAKLTYEIIMSLPESERTLLFDMLEPNFEKFDFDDFISEEVEIGYSDKQITEYLINTLFSKYKKLKIRNGRNNRNYYECYDRYEFPI